MATIHLFLRSLSPSLVGLTLFILILGFSTRATAQENENPPNIFLVIADDLGVDVSNGYHQGNLMPTTPTLDSLRSVGITFENVFAAPKCTPSRAAIMSAKYGINTGVTGTPGNLDFSHTSIFTALAEQTNNLYADALIGKWHLSNPADPQSPLQHGADYFMGVLGSGVSDYYAWDKTENGTTTLETTYATTAFTDAAIGWINEQEQPWFLWLAHTAPHSPFHEPPSYMYSVPSTGNNYRKYVAMIESIDYELNRLLYAMPDSVRENTLIIYIGDNGTPNNMLQDYPDGHGKSSLYQGGIRVPMIVAGAGVNRAGERESALVHINDIHATLLEVVGAELPGGLFNSLSFHHLLTNEPGPTRDYNYSEIQNEGENSGFTIRGPQYKLITLNNGIQEFYDLLNDSLEVTDLLAGTLTAEQLIIKADLEVEAEQIRTAWSCRDHIKNGDEEDVDCGGSYCAPCVTATENTPLTATGIRVYPNPSNEFFHITSDDQPIQKITLRTISGQILDQIEAIDNREVSIHVAHLNPQVLLLEITCSTGTQIMKVVKVR